MGELAVMGRTGDTRVLWNGDNEAEVENARRTFEDLTKKGYLAYSVDRRGNKGTQVREFDPEAEKLILAPPMAGG